MIDKLSTDKCVLCGSCKDICPVGAITFAKSERDFKYPQINKERCIRCNKCEKACPVLGFYDYKQKNFPVAFLGRNPNREIREKSTSGGLFHALASEILAMGGYVCGAVLTKQFYVKHIVSNRKEDVLLMMGSKYAQSDMSGVYREIESMLTQDKAVLFSGCPCQVAGLKAYLKKEYEKLYLVEVVCHGIPSDLMLKSYLALQEKKAKSKIKELYFRNKDHGWHSSAVKILFEDGSIYTEPITVDAYMVGFLAGITMKESCYTCPFREFKTGADFILGDFWGAEAEIIELDDNTGISAVIIGTQKGKELLDSMDIELREFNLDIIVKYNRNIVESTAKHPSREAFYEMALNQGYELAIQNYLWENDSVRIKRKIRIALRKCKYFLQGKGTPLY